MKEKEQLTGRGGQCPARSTIKYISPPCWNAGDFASILYNGPVLDSTVGAVFDWTVRQCRSR